MMTRSLVTVYWTRRLAASVNWRGTTRKVEQRYACDVAASLPGATRRDRVEPFGTAHGANRFAPHGTRRAQRPPTRSTAQWLDVCQGVHQPVATSDANVRPRRLQDGSQSRSRFAG